MNLRIPSTLSICLGYLLSAAALADCDAPDLSFPKHRGEVQGFKISKLWGVEDDPKPRTADTVVKFGDYSFLMSPRSGRKRPKTVKFDRQAVSKKLLSNFKSSPHYLEGMKQTFSLGTIEAYDLNGDSKPDVILFEVSPGANVYSGAIGILKDSWLTLVDPICF